MKYKDFGVSVAEATVLCKLTFPIWAPLELMIIVRMYQRHWNITLPNLKEFNDSSLNLPSLHPFSDDDDDSHDNNGNNTVNMISPINNCILFGIQSVYEISYLIINNIYSYNNIK